MRRMGNAMVAAWLATRVVTLGAGEPDPATLPGLRLWVRADAGLETNASGQVVSWADQSGHTNAFVPTTATNESPPRLVPDALNGRPAVQFENHATALALKVPVDASNGTVFIVLRNTYSANWGAHILGNGLFYTDHHGGVFTGGFGEFRYNQQRLFLSSFRADRRPRYFVPPLPMEEFAVCTLVGMVKDAKPLAFLAANVPRGTYGCWDGAVAEMLVYGPELSTADRRRVEAYLGRKYFNWPALSAVPVAQDAGARTALAERLRKTRSGVAADPAQARERVFFNAVADTPLPAGWYRLHLALAMRGPDPDLRLVLLVNHDRHEITLDRFSREPFTDFTFDFRQPVGDDNGLPLVRLAWMRAPIPIGERMPPPEGARDIREVSEKKIAALESVVAVRAVHIERLSPVVVQAVRADKILYRPGERGELTITLCNDSTEKTNARVRVSLVREAADEETLEAGKAIDLPPGAVETSSVPFTASGRWGAAARAVVSVGPWQQAAEDYFSVAETVAEVGLGARWSIASWTDEFVGGRRLLGRLGRKPEDYLPGSESGGDLPQQWQRVPRRARDIYVNWVEVEDWSPGEWAQLEPATSRWWSATASRPQLDEHLKSLVERCRKEGVQVAAQVDTVAAGPAAAALAGQHPSWFLAAAGQAPDAGEEVKTALAPWNDPTWRKANPLHPGTFVRVPDFGNREVLDHGLDQLIRSVRRYGWDLIRLDGWLSVPGDGARSAQNIRQLREGLAVAFPRLVVGFSDAGAAPERRVGVDGEWRAALAGGGLCILGDRLSTNRPPARWDEFARAEAESVRQVRAAGGHCYRDWKLDYAPAAEAYYTLVYGLMAGGHPFPFDRDVLPGCAHWGAFMTRWSGMLWDPALRAVTRPGESIAVEGAAVQWESWVRERAVSPTRKFVILHLVVPPSRDDIADTALPPRAGSMTIRYRPEKGTTLRRAVLVRPEAEPFETELTPTPTRGGFSLALSPFGHWAMAILEVEGRFEEAAGGTEESK